MRKFSVRFLRKWGREMEQLINDILEPISAILRDNMVVAPFLALLAGLITAFSPCSLSTVPLVIAYVGGTADKDRKKAFKISLVFAGGMAVTLTVLGVLSAVFGRIFQSAGSWWYFFLGALMIVMAFQVWELINIIPSTYAISKNKKRGYVGAFISGILGGLFSSPCSTPVLAVLLAIIAGGNSIAYGILLMLLYSLGHSVFVVIAGTSAGFVSRVATSEKYGRLSTALRIASGILVLLLGFYFFYLGF